MGVARTDLGTVLDREKAAAAPAAAGPTEQEAATGAGSAGPRTAPDRTGAEPEEADDAEREPTSACVLSSGPRPQMDLAVKPRCCAGHSGEESPEAVAFDVVMLASLSRAGAALVLFGALVPSPSIAQAGPSEGWSALSVERGRLEVYVVSPAGGLCLMSTEGCEQLVETEQTGTTARDGSGVPTAIVVTDSQGTRTLALERLLPRAEALFRALLRQCFHADFGDAPLSVCTSEREARRVLGAAGRIVGALGPGSPFELTDDAIVIRGSGDDGLANAADLSVRAALAGPRRTTRDALDRLLRAGLILRRDGSTGMPDGPPALRRALAGSLAAWMEEAERDHDCDATCGGCVPLSDRGLAAERAHAPQAIDAFALALDDALWARGLSAWTLADADAEALTRGVGRGAIEVECGRSDWRHRTFRRCARTTLERLATSTAASWAGTAP